MGVKRPAERPTVIVVGPLPPPVHGAAVVTAAMRERLRSISHVVVVNTSAGARRGARYHMRRLIRHSQCLAALVRHRRAARRCLYITTPAGAGLLYTVVLALGARLLGYQVVLHHHSFAYLVRRSVPMGVVDRVVGPRSAHVVLCTRMRYELRRQYRTDRIVAICSNAGLVEDGQPVVRSSSRAAGLTLGYLGLLTREKGLEDVIATFEATRNRGVATAVALAGMAGSRADDRMLLDARRRLGAQLREYGPVAGDAKDRFFGGLDVFLFPTRLAEAEPLVVLEALARGVPVVAYDRGCIGEELVGGGVVVPPSEPFVEHAATYIERLAREPGFALAERTRAREAFERLRAASRRPEEVLAALLNRP